jgi:ATP-binding cassette subfamily F protein uup
MAELSRQYANGIFTAEGPYSKFLEKREEYLTVREKLEESLATKVRREVEWLRRGAKARTTKSKARIGEANRLIAELDDVGQRNRTSTARIDFTASDRKTKKLIEAVGVAADGGGRRLFSGLNLTLRPGDRVGLVGPNGCGKSTLLGVLMGERAAAAGTVERADALQIVYFDQNRDQLDPDVPLKRALAEHGDSVQYRGRVVHVNGWAKRFLFRPEQLEVAVHRLSGGERARVLIARLMLREADVLLLDEPTNDLDIPTLEVLEESLLDFPGAMVLVTHDRFLLDRVATTVVGIEPGGTAGYYADYGQWEAAQQSRSMPAPKREEAAPKPAVAAASKKKLSYIEAREFESMEARILEAEATLAERKAQMEDPAVVSDPRRLQQAYADLTAAQASVENLYERWAELEAKAQ